MRSCAPRSKGQVASSRGSALLLATCYLLLATRPSRSWRRWLPGAAGAAALLATGGCGEARPRPVTIIAHSFRFEPATVEVAYQQPIRLTLRNPDVLEHDFHVDGLRAKVAAGGGQHGHGGAPGGQGHAGQSGQGGHGGQVDQGDSGSTGQPDDADILHVHTAAGQSAELVFTPLARGTFAVSCTIPGHKEAGMAATLVVH
jgi:uncharacterized cupredoxin-like copper-binding protein